MSFAHPFAHRYLFQLRKKEKHFFPRGYFCTLVVFIIILFLAPISSKYVERNVTIQLPTYNIHFEFLVTYVLLSRYLGI
jgi:hypothetical protein